MEQMEKKKGPTRIAPWEAPLGSVDPLCANSMVCRPTRPRSLPRLVLTAPLGPGTPCGTGRLWWGISYFCLMFSIMGKERKILKERKYSSLYKRGRNYRANSRRVFPHRSRFCACLLSCSWLGNAGLLSGLEWKGRCPPTPVSPADPAEPCGPGAKGTLTPGAPAGVVAGTLGSGGTVRTSSKLPPYLGERI